MLIGLRFLICQLLILGPAVLIVGGLVGGEWVRSLNVKPRAIAPALIALTIALLPDFFMLVSLLTGDRIIPIVANTDNMQVFSSWQVISGILIAIALSLSLFKRRNGRNQSLRASLILLFIHGAVTLLFFSDAVLAWFTT